MFFSFQFQFQKFISDNCIITSIWCCFAAHSSLLQWLHSQSTVVLFFDIDVIQSHQATPHRLSQVHRLCVAQRRTRNLGHGIAGHRSHCQRTQRRLAKFPLAMVSPSLHALRGEWLRTHCPPRVVSQLQRRRTRLAEERDAKSAEIKAARDAFHAAVATASAALVSEWETFFMCFAYSVPTLSWFCALWWSKITHGCLFLYLCHEFCCTKCLCPILTLKRSRASVLILLQFWFILRPFISVLLENFESRKFLTPCVFP